MLNDFIAKCCAAGISIPDNITVELEKLPYSLKGEGCFNFEELEHIKSAADRLKRIGKEWKIKEKKKMEGSSEKIIDSLLKEWEKIFYDIKKDCGYTIDELKKIWNTELDGLKNNLKYSKYEIKPYIISKVTFGDGREEFRVLQREDRKQVEAFDDIEKAKQKIKELLANVVVKEEIVE